MKKQFWTYSGQKLRDDLTYLHYKAGDGENIIGSADEICRLRGSEAETATIQKQSNNRWNGDTLILQDLRSFASNDLLEVFGIAME